jgi:hypothetical protein
LSRVSGGSNDWLNLLSPLTRLEFVEIRQRELPPTATCSRRYRG